MKNYRNFHWNQGGARAIGLNRGSQPPRLTLKEVGHGRQMSFVGKKNVALLNRGGSAKTERKWLLDSSCPESGRAVIQGNTKNRGRRGGVGREEQSLKDGRGDKYFRGYDFPGKTSMKEEHARRSSTWAVTTRSFEGLIELTLLGWGKSSDQSKGRNAPKEAQHQGTT